MTPAEVHLQMLHNTKQAMQALAGQPERRGFLPLNYRHYVRSASGYALRVSRGFEEYVERLSEHSPIDKLIDFLDFQSSGEQPAVFHSFTADDVDLIAVPVCLDRREVALRYLRQFLIPGKSTPLWQNYVIGLERLVAGEPFVSDIPARKLKGMENHWILFLRLMEDLSVRREDAGTRSEIADSFARCNKDRRLVEVTHIDPSGTYPLSWDLRSAYISKLATPI